MDGDRTAKGTVTSLSSLFSPDEVQNAAKRVEEAIAERTNELDRILSYVDDNSSLVKLVHRLPYKLHHDIMVPFGKGAFFPGRLVHTNEFMVLLGESYYADRTAKQTVDILNRRGKELESQAESLKAMIKDLKVEASFFNDTANEAAEGHVEIMEDYEDLVQTGKESSKAMQIDMDLMENKNINNSVEDKEFARIMARMEELEALEEEEMATEGKNSYAERLVSGNSTRKDEEDDLSTEHSSDTDDGAEIKGNDFSNIQNRKSNFFQVQPQNPVSHGLRLSERHQCETSATELFQPDDKNPFDKPELKSSAARPVPRGSILLRKDLAPGNGSDSISKKVSGTPKVSGNPTGQSSGERAPAQPSRPTFDSQKAFTGSIVERPYNLEPKNQTESTAQSPGSLPSKPVSRFKVQRK